MNKKLIVVFYILIAITLNGFNKSNYEVIDDVSKHIVSLAKKHRFLFMGQGDSHGSRVYNETLIKSIPGLVNEANVQFIVVEINSDLQDEVDKYMESGDEGYLYRILSISNFKPSFDNFAFLELFKFIYNFNLKSETKINIICSDQKISEYDIDNDGIIFDTLGSPDFPKNDRKRFSDYKINRDLHAYKKIVELSEKFPDAHFLIYWGSFHAEKFVPLLYKLSYTDRLFNLAVRFKTIAQYLDKKYNEELYSLSFDSIYNSEFSENDFDFNTKGSKEVFYNGLKNRKYTELEALVITDSSNDYYDELIFYNRPINYAYPMAKIFRKDNIYYLLQRLKPIKGKIETNSGFSLAFLTLLNLIDLIREEIHFDTYEEYYDYFSKWYEENKDTIVDMTDEEIKEKEYVYNLKIYLAYYSDDSNKNFIPFRFIDPDFLIEEIICSSTGNNEINRNVVEAFLKDEVEKLKCFRNLTFPFPDKVYYKYLYKYVKKHNYDVPEFIALYEKVESNY